jgi:hypothetical protein
VVGEPSQSSNCPKANLVSIFKKSRKYGTILLCVWLIASGLISLLDRSIPYAGPVLSVLAIVAGALILIDR